MTRCYIFHVIGTLTIEHIRRSLSSVNAQQPFHWERFVLYNGGDFTDDEILAMVPKDRFDHVEVFPYDQRTPKSAVADWDIQMRCIDGADRYLCHKADFYLPPWTCTALDEIEGNDWFVLFNKFDLKKRATLDDIVRYANLPWDKGCVLDTTGNYGSHMGKLAVSWHQRQGPDGTMHAYTDSMRQNFRPDAAEVGQKWGACGAIVRMSCHLPFLMDDRFFACHMWHPVPEKSDSEKAKEGEEF